VTAWYNEPDKQKAATLRHLIEAGAIAHGVVDERKIQAVQPDDLHGFSQCHFFAGCGVWSYALRVAGWPDDRPVWTGSCPCGPFSVAGLKKGFEDPRHLWPSWFPLILKRRPDVCFGEQSDDAHAWIDLVSSDMEDAGYAFGSPDIPAAGFSGAHIRQRYFWVADANNAERWAERAPWNDGEWPQTGRVKSYRDIGERGANVRMAHTYSAGFSDTTFGIIRRAGMEVEGRIFRQPGDPRRPGADWLLCRDGPYRPVEPGTCPLVDEAPARMGRLRNYGDAIDAETAANFIGAYMDAST